MGTLYRRLTSLAGAVVLAWLVTIPVQALTPVESNLEAIREFHSQIAIQENGDLKITETIKYFTPTPHHGIYRQIPYRYNRDGWRFTARVSNIQVSADGKKVQVEQSTDNAFLTLKIGDPDTTFTGSKTYVLQYTVAHAVLTSHTDSSQPELYWDITGESWQLPILQTTATITSPNELTHSECFSGPYGSNDEKCRLTAPNAHTATLNYSETVSYGDNVTVRLSLDPAGPVLAPSASRKLEWWLTDHWPLALLLVAPIVMIWQYRKRGRDWWYGGNIHTPDLSGPQAQFWPWSLPTVPFIYEPPKDLSPGEASILLHERVLPTALVSEILELTHRGYLTVERREKKKYWFVKKTLHGKLPALTTAQQTLLDGLFNGRQEVSLETLKGTFYVTAQKVQEQLEKQLVERKLIVARPGVVRGIWLTLSLTAAGSIGGLVLVVMAPFIPMLFWPLEIAAIVVCLVCSWGMPQRTAAGSNAAWRMKGLQKTIARGAWREKIKEKHLFVEEILPFAVAFGVVKQLSRDLKDLNLEPPDYAQALVYNGLLSSNLTNNFTSSTSSSFAPPSSSSSGWSGGGSSGGGGGGGGGGSW